MDSVCPEYRVRLFLSADLAGSTAFKAGLGLNAAPGGKSQPLWVQVTRDFYRQFPALVSQHFRRKSETTIGGPPQVWKTIGDEVIFCCRLLSVRHAACCVDAFLEALRDFGIILDQAGRNLDVKGCAWTAAFPAPNVTVSLDNTKETADQFDEAFERDADNDPRLVDFLGNGIDSGFRLASHSAVERCVLSAELALLLCKAASPSRRWFAGTFDYHDRRVLKGVLKDRPYPLVSVNTERSSSRQTVRNKEDDLLGRRSPQSWRLEEFLEAFLADEQVEPHALPLTDSELLEITCQTYLDFKAAWQSDVDELRQRAKAEQEAETVDASPGQPSSTADLAEIARMLLQGFKQIQDGVRGIGVQSLPDVSRNSIDRPTPSARPPTAPETPPADTRPPLR